MKFEAVERPTTRGRRAKHVALYDAVRATVNGQAVAVECADVREAMNMTHAVRAEFKPTRNGKPNGIPGLRLVTRREGARLLLWLEPHDAPGRAIGATFSTVRSA